MKRQFATPVAFRQAVEQRLLNEALRDGHDVHRVRQLLLFDRFLARLFAVPGDWLLKGGLVLEYRLERARTTRDIDLRTLGEADHVLARLQAAARVDLDDGLRFEVAEDPDHREMLGDAAVYGGRRFRVVATWALRPYGAPFGVDVVLGGPVVGVVDESDGKPRLDFAGIAPARVRLLPPEQHLAEKLHALTQPRPRPNSRVRDLPDLLLLGRHHAFDADLLRAALQATFDFRGTHPLPAATPAVPEAWTGEYHKQARVLQLPWLELADGMAALARFLDPVLAAGMGRWSPGDWAWG